LYTCQIQHIIALINDTFRLSRSVSQLQSGNIQQDIRQGQESNKKAFEEQRDALTQIRVRIQQCERFFIDRGNALARGVGEAVSRLTWLLEMTTELKNNVQQIISMNYRMYAEILRVQAFITFSVLGQPSLAFEQAWILEDCIGRISPVHKQFILSWEVP